MSDITDYLENFDPEISDLIKKEEGRQEDGLASTSPLVFPEAGLFSHTENWLVKLPDFTCKFRLKVKWDGGSSPNRVLVEKLDAQSLIYTTGSEVGARLGSTKCLF